MIQSGYMGCPGNGHDLEQDFYTAETLPEVGDSWKLSADSVPSSWGNVSFIEGRSEWCNTEPTTVIQSSWEI